MNRMTAAVLLAALAAAGACRGQESPATPVAPGVTRVNDHAPSASRHLIHDISPLADSGAVQVVVEIPAGTNAKWEVDKGDGRLKWEVEDGRRRIVKFLPYPGVLDIIAIWFTSYKGPGRLESKGYGGVIEAKKILRTAIDAYLKSKRARPE